MRLGDDAPLDLGVVGAATEPAPEPAEPRRPGGRWLWAVVAAAFVGGGALGLVVADSREDAAGYADVQLVSGGVEHLSGHADETAPGSVELSLLNLGEHEVEILGLEPPGMTVQADEAAREPVTVPPGEWRSVRQTGLIADCTTTVPDDELLVRVRDAGGTEQLVQPYGVLDYGGASEAWFAACQTSGPSYGLADVTTVTHHGETVVMDLYLSNTGDGPLRVLQFQPDAPGLDAPAPVVPFAVPGGEAVAVPLTWTVTDCDTALQWSDVQIDIEVSSGGGRQMGPHSLDGRARAELVLLVQRVCGDGG
jgi:hypothetical protein